MSLRQIILDTETTGLKVEEGHKVIEIGCLEMVNRKLTGRSFHHYLNPERMVDAGAVAIHGLNNDFLQDKPTFQQIVQEFIDFIRDGELIIHNAPFDLGFLNYELSLIGQPWQKLTDYCQVVDTLLMARKLHVGQRNSLDALCKRYSVDLSKREFHGALLDAHLLAQVYLAMTGGQSSLFETGDEGQSSASTRHQAKSAPLTGYDLVIQSASAEELSEHEHYLSQLKQRGQCVWPDEEIVGAIKSS